MGVLVWQPEGLLLLGWHNRQRAVLSGRVILLRAVFILIVILPRHICDPRSSLLSGLLRRPLLGNDLDNILLLPRL